MLSRALYFLQAYQAWLGFYKGSMRLIRKDAAQLVELANSYSIIMGAHQRTPSILPSPSLILLVLADVLLMKDLQIICQACTC